MRRKKKKTPFHAGGNFTSHAPQPVAYGWCLYSRITGELFGREDSALWVFRTKAEAVTWRMGMFFASDYVVHRVRFSPVKKFK